MTRPATPLRIPLVAMPLVAVASAGLAVAIGAGVCALCIGATLAEIAVAARRARRRLTLRGLGLDGACDVARGGAMVTLLDMQTTHRRAAVAEHRCSLPGLVIATSDPPGRSALADRPHRVGVLDLRAARWRGWCRGDVCDAGGGGRCGRAVPVGGGMDLAGVEVAGFEAGTARCGGVGAMSKWTIIHGDVNGRLPELAPESFDASFSDPPYGLSFMGREWDHGVPSAEMWAALLRTLKPGAPLLAFGGTRTFHRLTCAIEDAGAEIRDCLMWMYGQGFPKSHSIGKAIDAAAGADREAIGVNPNWRPNKGNHGDAIMRPMAEGEASVRSAPATPEAATWEGYGTALKPAWEPCILAMKPLDGTFAHNALTHGVAGLNVDGGRIGTSEECGRPHGLNAFGPINDDSWTPKPTTSEGHPSGRWPANLILCHTEDCEQGEGEGQWRCVPGCPVAMLDGQGQERGVHGAGHARTGEFGGKYSTASWSIGAGGPRPMGRFGDTGGASRFFYQAKASASERHAGLEHLPPRIVNDGRATSIDNPYQRGDSLRRNTHPCVKPIDLCRYLATLILPPKRETPRRLLVPFSGSGSEMIGALLAGWDEVVGIEMEAEYIEIAWARLTHWVGDGCEAKPATAPKAEAAQLDWVEMMEALR